MGKYDDVALKCLNFIKSQMNVNDYTLFPKLKEEYEQEYTGKVFGLVDMPSSAYVEFPSYIYCDEFYDETYTGVCSGKHQNVGNARSNLGVEVTTYTDKQYTSAVCPLHSDGTWRTETYYKTTEVYGVDGAETQRIIYWTQEDKIVNESGSNGIKNFTLKYYKWIDDDGNIVDVDNLPPTTKKGQSAEGQQLMFTEIFTLKPVLIDDEEIDNAIPYYPDYIADFFILADVEYLAQSTNLLYDNTVQSSDLPSNPLIIPPNPIPIIRDVCFSPSYNANELEVSWVSNFFESCTLNINGAIYTIKSLDIADGYRSYKCRVKANMGSIINYEVSGNGVSVAGSFEYPNSNVYRICGDPQITDEVSADNWYKSQRVESPFGKKPALLLSMGDQIDSINDPKLKRKQYTMFVKDQYAPIMVTRGNHDRNETYFAQYSTPNSNINVDGNYYFIHNGTLFVVLDTNSNNYERHKNFINTALGAGNYSTAILVMHHGMYTVGSNAYAENVTGLRNNLGPFIQSKPFNVVLSGHDHIFCRNFIDNKLYMVAPSSSGSKYYKVENANAPWSDVHKELNIPCVIDMEILPNTINLKMIDINGLLLDEISIPK